MIRSSIPKNAWKSGSFSVQIQNLNFSRKLQNKVDPFNILEISRDKSIVDSTWGIIKDFFKMSQTTKYSTMIE
jgi:hypothetical protein